MPRLWEVEEVKVPHRYCPNGMGAMDEKGEVPCALCGLGEYAHPDNRQAIPQICDKS